MTDSTLPEKAQKEASSLSPEEYKSLCKRVKAYQLQNGARKRRAKPIINTLGELEVLAIKAKAQKAQTDWEVLKNGMPFVTDITATLVYVKTSKERAFCLNTMQSVPVAGGMVHRVFL